MRYFHDLPTPLQKKICSRIASAMLASHKDGEVDATKFGHLLKMHIQKWDLDHPAHLLDYEFFDGFWRANDQIDENAIREYMASVSIEQEDAARELDKAATRIARTRNISKDDAKQYYL